jgi:DNA-binding NarL/FixJ family response regulator
MEFDVLLVDDSQVYRDSFRELIARHYPEVTVEEAANSADAWRRLDVCSPRLIFSDISLQGEDGFEFIRQVRQSYPDVVLAVITGHDGQEYREAAYARGADCYVPKNTASSTDILCLIDAIRSGRPPVWDLGSDYLNPAPPARPWK